MGLNEHWKVQYSDTTQLLAGSQDRAIFKELISQDNKKGDTVFLDSYGVNDPARRTAMASMDDSRKDYEASAQAFADYAKMLTPHMDINRARTLCLPFENIWGHTFRKIDEVAANANEHSKVMKAAMASIWAGQDYEVLNALFAQTVTRKVDQATSSVAMPAGQQMTVATGGLVKDVITQLITTFDDNRITKEPIFLAITPAMKENLILTDGDKINSSDFVDKKYLLTRELPDIHGVHIICDPLVKSFVADAAGTWDGGMAVAWTAEGATFNQFDPMTTDLGISEAQKFQAILQLQEFIGAARTDDKRVVHLRFGTATP